MSNDSGDCTAYASTLSTSTRRVIVRCVTPGSQQGACEAERGYVTWPPVAAI